ncbi:helical backbone metal receptor [Proteinivorax hydrogeniformans]|uniref:Helical backbone metal receptor n=1 Tax=Proteinivorax hydrogeniformans TaxID=1826727 RepID=A0AAU8HVA4_9FIRM
MNTRVVSLVPSATESMYYLGLEDFLVGVTTHCNYPEAAKKNKKVGSFAQPDIAKVLSANPDIVLASSNLHKKVATDLSDNGIRVINSTPSTINEILAFLETLVEACLGGEGNDSIKNLRSHVENVTQENKRRKIRTLRLMFKGVNAIFIPTAGSYQYDALKILGAKQLENNNESFYLQVSLDDIKRFDPEVILLCNMDSEEEKAYPRCYNCSLEGTTCHKTACDQVNEKLSKVTAVKEGKVYPLSCSALCRPGPRLINSLKLMSNQIHK